jgi:hypothetical protein
MSPSERGVKVTNKFRSPLNGGDKHPQPMDAAGRVCYKILFNLNPVSARIDFLSLKPVLKPGGVYSHIRGYLGLKKNATTLLRCGYHAPPSGGDKPSPADGCGRGGFVI